VSRIDIRLLKHRNLAKVIIYGEAHQDQLQSSADYFGQLLLKENKVESVHILQGGYDAFKIKYPFLECFYSPKEMTSGRHAHKPPLPWYPNEILDDFLYLGNHSDSCNKMHLYQLGIRYILNCASELDNAHPQEFKYLRCIINDYDDEDITQHFQAAFDFMDEARRQDQRVLIHCHQGISRSSTVLLAYIMHVNKWSLQETFEHVRCRRPQIFPNVGFWQQLGSFETQRVHHGDRSRSTLSKCVDLTKLFDKISKKSENIPESKSDAASPSQSQGNDISLSNRHNNQERFSEQGEKKLQIQKEKQKIDSDGQDESDKEDDDDIIIRNGDHAKPDFNDQY